MQLASGAALDYDWLLLATGARHSYFGRDEWAEHAPGIKSIEDATAVRRKVLLALERAETEMDPERRKALLTFVVIGGGPTGVEMAGAIAELAHRSVSREFRSITPHCSRVVLIEGGDRLLPSFPEALSARRSAAIEQLGVEVRLNAAGHRHRRPLGPDRRRMHRRRTRPSGRRALRPRRPPAGSHAQCDRAGRVLVGSRPARAGMWPTVFAIGDTASCPGLDGRPVPGIAPVAKQQGKHFAATVLAAIAGRRAPPPFRYRSFGNLATIGRSKRRDRLRPAPSHRLPGLGCSGRSRTSGS